MKPIRMTLLVVAALAGGACASNATHRHQMPPSATAQDVKVSAAIGRADSFSASQQRSIPLLPATAAQRSSESAARPIPIEAADIESPISEVAAANPGVASLVPDEVSDVDMDSALYADDVIRDPWEEYNRRMHGFNNVVDKYVLRPLAVGYDKALPDVVQSGVTRFFANLGVAATSVNQALQGEPVRALQSLGRFAVNATLGIGGVMDIATRLGMPRHDDEDFGQTLATWGWRDSRYLVMPLLGPRTVRDGVAILGDQRLSLIGYVEDSGTASALQFLQVLDGRSRMLSMDQTRHEAHDEYAFVRDVWAQRRRHQIERNPRKGDE